MAFSRTKTSWCPNWVRTRSLYSARAGPGPELAGPVEKRARQAATSLQEHPGLIELLGFQEDGAPSVDKQRDGLLAILRNAGIDDRTAVDGLGSLVALTLVSRWAPGQEYRLNDHAYERLGKLSLTTIRT